MWEQIKLRLYLSFAHLMLHGPSDACLLGIKYHVLGHFGYLDSYP